VNRSQTTLAGLKSIALANMLARLIGLAGQLALGWFLTPRDFGVYALAVGISGALTSLRNGGTTQVLVTRAGSYAKNAGLYFRFSLAFNIAIAAALLIASTVVYKRKPDLAVILAGIAFSLPIGTRAALLRGELTIHRKFRELSVINVGSAITWQLSVCCLAWLGFGARSFAVPPVLQAIVETVLTWLYASDVPKLTRYFRSEYLNLFRDARWVMLSALVLTFATTGDYLAVGMLADLRTTGAYFFSFQLAAALGVPISASIDAVLPAFFAKAGAESGRQQAIYRTATNFVLLLVVPASVGVALIAPPIVHLAWKGKWDYATPAIQLLVACTPAWLLVGISRALLDARGLWQLRFLVIGIYGVGGISAAAVGALTNKLGNIALLVTGFYVLFAVTLSSIMGHLLRWSPRAGAISITPALAINGIALAGAVLVANYSSLYLPSTPIVTLLIYLMFVGLGIYCFLRHDFASLWSSLLRRDAEPEQSEGSRIMKWLSLGGSFKPKALLKPFVPQSLRKARSRYRAGKLDAALAGRPLAAVFEAIYREKLWGNTALSEYDSGPGSTDPAIVTPYIEATGGFLKTLPGKPNVVDLGCGDFSVGSKLRHYCARYVACDVVPDLIAHNTEGFLGSGVDFRVLDIVDEDLPDGDVVFIRQVFQHLSNAQISKVVPKLAKYRWLVLTEHLPNDQQFIPNKDKPAGPGIRARFGSGIVLTASPFLLPTIGDQVLCQVEYGADIIKTTAYQLAPFRM
jgi:O-antigen/teichoic acid export membrane protein